MNIIKYNSEYAIYNQIEILKEFPTRNYELVWDGHGNCSLRDAEDIPLPKILYDLESDIIFRKQVITSFNNSTKNMGVLLEGYKGQGKSITAKRLCKELALPVILITRAIPLSVDFIGFLNKISQEYVLFIDEFEKIFKSSGIEKEKEYHNEDSFLSFMDGGLSGINKKLFLLTGNDKIGDKFINRPSRIMWYRKYEFIPEELYNIVIEDKLKIKEFEEDLRQNLTTSDCTVDLLNMIIDQINLLQIPYSSFKAYFNHKPRLFSYNREILKNEKFVYDENFETELDFFSKSFKFYRGMALHDHYVTNIKKADANEIIYERNVNSYDEDDDFDGKSKIIKNIYRIVKAKSFKKLIF